MRERSSLLHINGTKHSYSSLTFPLKRVELIPWLRAQTIYPKVYWKDRGSNVEIAALGSCLESDQVPQFYSPLPEYARFFGGISFSREKKGGLWSGFPGCRFFLPAYEIMQTAEDTLLILRFIDRPPEEKTVQNLLFSSSKNDGGTLSCLGRKDSPSSTEWEENLLQSLKLIDEQRLEKVVLARCSSFSFNERVEPLEMLEKIQRFSPQATHFAFQADSESAFIGATPEKLYDRQDNQIFSDALAGTRPRGQTAEEDDQLEKDLLYDDKEKREFHFVKTFIHTHLFPLCSDYHWEKEDRVIKQLSVQHLYNRFSGTLHKNVFDRDLLELLHPTPALGGVPRQEALQFIQTAEPFDRGWYGGPIGWLTRDRASFAVGIRSALVRREQLHLFSGVGVVSGSDPKREWEELEYKITPFKKIIYGN